MKAMLYLINMKSFFLCTLLLLVGCSTSNEVNIPDDIETSIWCVSEDNIAGSGTYELMDDPQYVSVTEMETMDVLNENSRMALLNIDDKIYAYPYDYTNKYEVINDSFGDLHLAFSYCPQTESARCFNRKLSDNQTIKMIASGFLFKDNQVASDSDLKYFWSQMSSEGLREESKEIRLSTVNIIESAWSIVKDHFPNALVFNHPDFVGCNCDEEPTPINYNNQFGVIHERNVFSDITHLFNYDNFKNGIGLDYAIVNGKTAMVVGSKNKIFFNAFYISSTMSFTPLNEDQFPNILSDNEGNIWNAFGVAIEGPRLGERLSNPKSYVAAPWAWKDIFEETIIH